MTKSNSDIAESLKIWQLLTKSYDQQNDTSTEQLFKNVTNYGLNLSTKNSIFELEDINSISQKFKSFISSHQAIFFSQYGSAVIFRRQKDWREIVIDLVFPVAWNLGSEICQKQLKMFPINALQMETLNIGRYGKIQNNFKYFIKQFSQITKHEIMVALAQQSLNQQQNRKNHHTPSWLYQILLISLEKISTKSQQQMEEENDGQKLFYSKGGTLDVGIHTGTTKPNTSLSIGFALIKYIFGTGEDQRQQYKIFELSYKLNLLQKISQTQSIEWNIHTLRSIIQEFKILNSYGFNYSHQNLSRIVKNCMNEFSNNDQKQLITKKRIQKDYTKHASYDKKFSISKLSTNPSRINPSTTDNFKSLLGASSKTIFQIPIESQKLFSPLVYPHILAKQTQWILLVEKTLFNIANNYLRKNIPLPIRVSDITENNILIKIVKKYQENLRSKNKNYIGSANQKQSLIFLVKLIACIVIFQVNRRERKDLKANLNNYRIPFNDIQLFFNKFSSMSYEARQAMQSVYIYFIKQREKKPIFVLQKSNESYFDFAMESYDQSATMKKWLQQKQDQISKKKQVFVEQLINFHNRMKNVKKEIQKYIIKICECTGQSQLIKIKGKIILTQILCARCKKITQLQKNIQKLQSTEGNYLKLDLPEEQNNKKLYAFLANIPPQIVTMIKIFNILYGVALNSKNQRVGSKNVFSVSYQKLAPYARAPATKKFIKLQITTHEQVEELYIYSSSLAYLQYEGSTTPAKFNAQIFDLQTKNQIIKWASDQPVINDSTSFKSKLREHQIYSKVEQSQQFQLSAQQFINICSVRVSLRTQLPILCSKLLTRKIVLDIFKSESFQLIWQTIIRTSSSLIAHKFNKQIALTPIIIEESASQLLNEYHKSWNYTQINSLIFFGPFMSLFSKYLQNQKGPLNLLNCAYREFNKLNNELKQQQGKIVQIRARQAFISFSALCCLTQQILSSHTPQENQLFVFFIVIGHSCAIFVNQNKEDHRNFESMKSFKFIKQRSKFKNLPAVLHYFQKYPNKLNNIVRKIDESCLSETHWENVKQIGNFVFRGVMKIQNKRTQYLLNIESGILLKNGKQLTGLSVRIKDNKYFKQIFGSRDFQVYHNQDSCRTKRGFKEILSQSQQENTNIFFQFKQSTLGQVQIKMIEQKLQQGMTVEQEYVLINREILKKYQFIIPPLFLKGCLAWHCENKKCIIFRKPKLEQLQMIEMILFLEPKNSLVIRKGILISNECKKKSLSTIISMQSSNCFEQIVLRSKEYNHCQQSLTYKIISQIQDWQYVIQLKKQGYSKFWLHRYSLTFRLQKKYLVLEGYGKYAVCQSSNDYCPWSKLDVVRAIWLQKTQQNLFNSMKHSLRIIIPNLQLDIEGYIMLPSNYDAKISIFQYDIHDHFKDIRGQNSQANLHLASILISKHKYRRMKNLGMTLNQYCQNLIRSCYNLRPFTSANSLGSQNKSTKNKQYNELQKIQSIIYDSSENKNCSVLLCCQVLLELSKNFQCLYKQNNLYQINSLLKTYKQKFSLAKHNYTKTYKTIGQVQKLNKIQMDVLGLKLSKSTNSRIEKLWFKNYPLKINISVEKWNQLQNNLKKNLQKVQQFYANILKGNNQINANENQFELKQKLIENLNMKNDNKRSLIYTEMIAQQSQSLQSSLTSSKKNYKFQNIQKFSTAKTKSGKHLLALSQNKREINMFITELINENNNHIDILSQKIPKFTSFYYTNILCEKKKIRMFYPNSTDDQVDMFYKILKFWMILTVQIDSMKRLKLLLQEGTDKKAIRRELQSPRRQIQKFVPWICYEAQMRIKIWASQYQTYKNLSENQNRSFSQLNMGEGKTQVIIPMFVLYKLFNLNEKDRRIPRINLLSSLLDESRSNYFRFFTATTFKIPCIQIPFNRSVELNEQNIINIKRGLSYFGNYLIVLSDRESCLSMILKIREMNEIADNYNEYISEYLEVPKQKWLFGSNKVFDILDEVDALVTPKKSFVYSIGGSSDLPGAIIRIQLCRYLIEILVKQMLIFCFKQQIITCESFNQLENANIQGRFPRIRYIALQNQEKRMMFKQKIIQLFLSTEYLPQFFSFYPSMKENEKQQLKKYLIDEKLSQKILKNISVPKLALNQIFAVRGILAYGILQHCLSLRCGVQFGVPGIQHPKRVAVPYQAADVPSKRSQYAQPDVATILSYISRYIQGLSYKQFEQCMNKLNKLTLSVQKVSYLMWLKQLKKQVRIKLNKEDVTKLNIKSKTQMDQLFSVFRNIRPTIAFWLNKIVFPTDLKQYTDSITSSSWDIANSQESIGFSGTKDTRWIFPAQLNWLPSQDHQIKGTDGRNIELLMAQTKSLVQIKESQVQNSSKNIFLWQKFLVKALQENVTCIIDAGAILVGKSIQHEICNWIGDRIIQTMPHIKGITFPNKNGKWIVYDFRSKIYIDRGTKIAQHETFVIFDQARTRGSDIKMSSNVCAAISLCPNMTKDKLMQAMGRLRKIQVGQTIKIFASTEVLDKIEGFQRESSLEYNIKMILKWLIENSVKQNQKYLFQNNRLAWIHFRSVNLGMRPYIQRSNPELQAMYNKAITQETPLSLNNQIIDSLKKNEKDLLKNPIAKIQFERIKKYGDSFKIKCQGLDEVCERQVEQVEEIEYVQEKEICQLRPLYENNELVRTSPSKITTLPFEFDQNFTISQNFRRCTIQQEYNFEMENRNNELMHVNFVQISSRGICLITQRQANKLLRQNIKYLNPKKHQNICNQRYIIKFDDLTINSKIISQLNLAECYVDIKFFNGKQQFSKDKIENKQLSQFEILRKRLKNIRKNKIINWQTRLDDLTGHFLERRGTLMEKYQESSLEKICISLKNDPI